MRLFYLLSSALIGGGLLFAEPVQAAPVYWQQEAPQSLRSTYQLTYSGLPIGQIHFNASHKNADWQAELQLQVADSVSILSWEKQEMQAAGKVQGSNWVPERYDSQVVYREGTNVQIITYDAQGAITGGREVPAKEQSRPVVSKADLAKAYDPVTAIVWISANGTKELVKQSLQVFDGKRLMSLQAQCLNASVDNCRSVRVTRTLKAGFTPREQELYTSLYPDIVAEFPEANISEGGTLPEKIRMKTSIGEFLAVRMQ